MLSKILILKFLFLNAEGNTIVKATEQNFPSFVSLTDGKEPFSNFLKSATHRATITSLAPPPYHMDCMEHTERSQKRVCDGVILTKNAILTSAACQARPGGKVFYKTFDLAARTVPRSTIVSLQKHRKAKRIKLKNKKGMGNRFFHRLI